MSLFIKNCDPQNIKNYGPDFERFMLIKCSVFFFAFNLIAASKSGFQAGYSCINQLFSIIHKFLDLLMKD